MNSFEEIVQLATHPLLRPLIPNATKAGVISQLCILRNPAWEQASGRGCGSYRGDRGPTGTLGRAGRAVAWVGKPVLGVSCRGMHAAFAGELSVRLRNGAPYQLIKSSHSSGLLSSPQQDVAERC